MFVIFSTGKIVNLNHIVAIDPYVAGSLKLRMPNGMFDIVSGATEDDYEAVLEAIKGCNDANTTARKAAHPNVNQSRARAGVS